MMYFEMLKVTLFFCSPLLIPFLLCSRWAYRCIEAERPRTFLAVVNVAAALGCLLITAYVYLTLLSGQRYAMDWKEDSMDEGWAVREYTEYTEQCEKMVLEELRCRPRSANYDLGYFDDSGSVVSSTGKTRDELRKYAKRSNVICGLWDLKQEENFIPAKYLSSSQSMSLDHELVSDKRLYPTCRYSFICETRKTSVGWETQILSGKLEEFARKPHEYLSEPIWRPGEWGQTIPATQELCRKFLLDLKNK
jgi:hypothetical protein